SDNFLDVFGSRANLARGVVDASLRFWERVIPNFNRPDHTNSIDVTISMDSKGTKLGGSADDVTDVVDGFPVAGKISIGGGNDLNGDGIGDGGGWFLDPTPFDWSEFQGPTVNAFAGSATPGGPAAGQSDLFTVVTSELAHVLGQADDAVHILGQRIGPAHL